MGKFGWSYPPGAANDPNAPWNQEEYIAENCIVGQSVSCPACQETAEFIRMYDHADEEFNFAKELIFEGWHCENCDWEQETIEEDFERLREYEENLKPRIAAVNKILLTSREPKEAITVDDLFEHAPEGDFNWGDETESDWHVYSCGDSDCPTGWHQSCPYMGMGRKDGARWVEVGTIDFDGDRDCSAYWIEGEGQSFEESWIGNDLAGQSDSYFKGWAEYWLDCAETGKDPLDQCTRNEPRTGMQWMEFCVAAAEDLAKYLVPKTER